MQSCVDGQAVGSDGHWAEASGPGRPVRVHRLLVSLHWAAAWTGRGGPLELWGCSSALGADPAGVGGVSSPSRPPGPLRLRAVTPPPPTGPSVGRTHLAEAGPGPPASGAWVELKAQLWLQGTK